MSLEFQEEWEHRTGYHPPKDEAVKRAHEIVRGLIKDVGINLCAHTFQGREQAVMLTKLEEVMFWANASIARLQ